MDESMDEIILHIQRLLREVAPGKEEQINDVRPLTIQGSEGFTFGPDGLALDFDQAEALFERLGRVPPDFKREVNARRQGHRVESFACNSLGVTIRVDYTLFKDAYYLSSKEAGDVLSGLALDWLNEPRDLDVVPSWFISIERFDDLIEDEDIEYDGDDS